MKFKNNKIINDNHKKRRVISQKECLFDLKDHLPLIFNAFAEGTQAYNSLLMSTPSRARIRGFEATLLNAKIVEKIQEAFPENWIYGKYKRFLLRINGYTILCKKLDKNGFPMNIKTKATSAISNQIQHSLFGERDSFTKNPIVFFGYKKTKEGIIYSPCMTYIDEGKLKWIISEEHLNLQNIEATSEVQISKAVPSLKKKDLPKTGSV